MRTSKAKKFNLMKIIMILFFGFTFGLSKTVEATENSSEQEVAPAAGFTYNIEYPENQITPDIGYFDLMMTPGQQQTLLVTLSNPSAEDVTVDLALNGAKTNRNGVIEYANDEIEEDPSLPFSFTEIITGPNSVDLAPGETKQVEINVQMPETSFEGIITGGLQMILAEDETTAESGSGATVVNRYAYVVAIVLQESEGVLQPDLAWNSAYAGQMNSRNAIFINFSNIIGTYVNGMSVEAQISEQGSNEVLYESRSTSLRMAPNSFIEYPVSMNGERMTAGMYTAHVLVSSGELNWEFTEDFEITEEDANQYNERDVGLTQERGVDWQLIAMIVGGFILAVLVIFLVVRQVRKGKKKKKQPSKKRTTKKGDKK